MEDLRVEDRNERADAELVAGALDRDESAIRTLIQKYNRRLYRVARSVIGDDAEAEDVLQDAYVRAFSALGSYRGEASLATWLTRIVVNEALQRLRHRKTHRLEAKTPSDIRALAEIIPFPIQTSLPDPEITMAQREICALVEQAIDGLPQEFRTVLVARTIEGMSTEETADILGLKAETVKTRLHRARQMLKAALDEHLETQFAHVFPFDGVRCKRIADTVIAALGCKAGTFQHRLHPICVTATRASVRCPSTEIDMRTSSATALIAGLLLSAGIVLAADKPTDAQIAHIAYTAGEIDIKAARQALDKSKTEHVHAFANDMLRDHEAVNEKALALVKKLNVAPEDNDTSKALVKAADAKHAELAELSGAAFDKAYIDNEVAYHKTVNAALNETLIPSASNAELKALLETGLKIFEGHQQHAEHLAAKTK